jgi:hypothetical protein
VNEGVAALLGAGLALIVGGSAVAAGPPSGAHPRFLVGNLKSQLQANYAAGKPQIMAVVQQCDSQAGMTTDSGYQGWTWAHQMSACAIAWHATGNAAEATQAVTLW